MMNIELLGPQTDVWVTKYIAVFCLATIIIWGAGMLFWSKKREQAIRDCATYLFIIGVLTVVLALRPHNINFFLWPPLAWFSIAMLMVMELLWIHYVIDGIFHMIFAPIENKPAPPPRRSYYHRL
jgi:hypothetical protein